MIRLPRRSLPAASLALTPWVAARAAPPPLRFRIMRSGSQIGTHRVTFADEAGGAVAALTEVDIAVKLAGFTVFRMTHRFREVWQDGRLREASSRLERQGRLTEMTVRAEAGGLLVQGTEGSRRLPAEAAPLTWWDMRRFDRPLFDNGTGKPLALQWSREALPGGALRFRCTGDEEGDGTYAADGAWLAWATRGEDGSAVAYERG